MSSHRQTIVSGSGRRLSSRRSRNVRSSKFAKLRARSRSPNNCFASVVRPAAARPAICSLDDRQFNASDTRRFAGAKNSGDCRSLEIVDSHVAGFDLATQQKRQLDVRNQMKPTSEVVARDGFGFPASRNGYVLQTLPSVSSKWPAVGNKWNAGKLLSQLQSLDELLWVGSEKHAKPCQAAPRCLLANYRNLSAVLAQICRDRQQQRSATRNDDALAAHWETAFDHRLQATRTHHIGQGPARKRQKPFAGPGCQHQILVASTRKDHSVPSASRHSWFRLVKDPNSAERGNSRSLQSLDPSSSHLELAGLGILPSRFVPRDSRCRQRCPPEHQTQRHGRPQPCPRGHRQPPEHRTVVVVPYSSFIRSHFHTLCAQNLAAPAVWPAVNGYATLKANPHSAQRPARFTVHGNSAGLPGNHHGNRYGCARGHRNRQSVHRHRDLTKHAGAPLPYGKADRVRWRLRVSHP